MVNKIRNLFLLHKTILALLVCYIIVRSVNLTLLPIFNDESIYLDWGWFETHVPGNLFYSLFDAKQPLLLWVFGITENFFSDPLFAGRFVSVLMGSLTLIGMYKITSSLTDRKTALIAGMLYMIIPLFTFYDRQALMESAVTAVGIWSFDYVSSLLETGKRNHAIMLGLLLGIGFLIKTSAFLFIVSALLTGFLAARRAKNKLFFPLFLQTLGVIAAVNSILLIQPLFWQTLPSNSRYSHGFSHGFLGTLISLFSNAAGFFQIGFIFLTPVVFFSAIFGIGVFLKKKPDKTSFFLLYFFIPLAGEILLVRGQSQRYLVPFLSFLIIPASYALTVAARKLRIQFLILLFLLCTFSIPLFLSLLVLFKPEDYFLTTQRFTAYTESEYITGQTAGYGIPNAIDFINTVSKKQNIIVATARVSGNPENAVVLYTEKNPHVSVTYMEKGMIDQVTNYTCLSSVQPLYFISRSNQLAGLDTFFERVRLFPNPYSNYYTGIYQLRKNCRGKTFSILLIPLHN